MSKKIIDLTGTKFGRLTVKRLLEERFAYRDLSGKTHFQLQWECECECGNIITVLGGNLKRGNTTSCGCLHKELLANRSSSHGCSGTKLYSVWCHMRNRCSNPKDKDYEYYGGRGIKVCSEWLNDFETFRKWAISSGYTDDHKKMELTIERKDVNGNYSPDNCCWTDMKCQSINKSNNHLIEFDGKTYPISVWAQIYNLPYSTLIARLNRLGWDVERALTTPVKTYKRS